jgi:hypothetical protein
MTVFETVAVIVCMFMQGLVVGYILWAPETPFKQGLVDGLSLKFLWGKK